MLFAELNYIWQSWSELLIFAGITAKLVYKISGQIN